MSIVNIEISYKTASAGVLERVACNVQECARLDELLASLDWVDEVALLSTCNRTEFFLSLDGDPRAGAQGVLEAFTAWKGEGGLELESCSVMRADDEAIEHLFSTACGLESMALGEDQIVAQIRRAVKTARDAHSLGPRMAELFSAALRTSKKARVSTGISHVGVSLVHAGLRGAVEYLGALRGRTVLLVGSGTIGALAGRLVKQEGASVLVSSRTWANAVALADRIGDGEPVPPGRLHDALGRADMVVSATASKDVVLTADDLRAARTSDDPLFVLDLAVPRDVDPSCGDLPGVRLVDVHDVGKYLCDHTQADQMDAVRRIVRQEAMSTVSRDLARRADPAILALRTRVRAEACEELDRLFRQLPDMAAPFRAATEAATFRLVSKFLHGPTIRTKELAAQGRGPECLELFCRIFDLDHGDEVIHAQPLPRARAHAKGEADVERISA